MSSPINIANFEVQLSLPEVDELQVHIMDDLADDFFIRGTSMESLCSKFSELSNFSSKG
jgi:hypothetical protein